MPEYGLQWKANAILLFGITCIPRIYSLVSHNLQNQRYDYIDVAKETADSRHKGQTTRIFTTDDELDENFWLKYLGVDFRDAVQLHVDGQSTAIPLVDGKLYTKSTPKHKPKADKRTRYVRQPTQEENSKQLSVDNLRKPDSLESAGTTENPDDYLSTTINTTNTTTSSTSPPTTTHLLPADKKHNSYNTQQHLSNKKPSKHKDKLLLCNKNNKKNFVKMNACREQKATNNPTNHTYVAVIEQIPPLVYHQKVELYPENKSNRELFKHANELLGEQIHSLYLLNQNAEFYDQPLQHNIQHVYPLHITTDYDTHSHHTIHKRFNQISP